MPHDTSMPDPAHMLAELEAELRELDELRLAVAGRWRDLHAFGGPAPVSGYAPDEWLALVGRMSGFESRRLEQVAARLPSLPHTDRALWDGDLSLDQAGWILDATRRLSGGALAEADERACALAVDVNQRGDDPDIRPALDRLVWELRDPSSADRTEQRQLDGRRVYTQPALDGGGRIVADLDPIGFVEVIRSIEHAAGRPAPGVPRRRQRADGLVALASHWHGDPPTSHGAARPAVTVLVELADVTTNVAGTALGAARSRYVPLVTARTLQTLTCAGDLLVQLTEGARPLVRIKDQDRLPDHTRRAVLTRDGGCRWPGCSAPTWQADVHHIHEQGDGGDHHPDNLVTLCRRHHRRLHGTHWSASLDASTAALSLFRGHARCPTHTTLPHDRAAPLRPDWTPTPDDLAQAARHDHPPWADPAPTGTAPSPHPSAPDRPPEPPPPAPPPPGPAP